MHCSIQNTLIVETLREDTADTMPLESNNTTLVLGLITTSGSRIRRS